VKTTSVNLSSRLRETILKTARKKLGSLGFEKTTMQGIARELSVSKATLYYYFPDKEGLFMEVIAREEAKYFRTLELRMKNITDPEAKLSSLVQLMNDFCREFTHLNKLRLSDPRDLRPCFGDRFGAFHDRELHLVKGIIEEGVRSGVFRNQDLHECAGIFLDVLNGLRLLANTDNESKVTLENRQRVFLRIFTRSLKK
jgi:TetR/AcrR family transcriptional regulator